MTGRFLRTAALGIALAAGTLATENVARATTFAELSIEQFTDASTYIVEGEVTKVWTELDETRGVVFTKAQLDVSEVHKGPDAPTELTVSSMGGVHGTYETYIPGMAVFSEGEQVFLFLDQTDDGRLVPASKFLGKYTIRRAAHADRKHAMTWHPKQGQVFDHRFLPHPDPDQRVYVDDLREQVQRRLDTGWDGQPVPGIALEKLERINTPEFRSPR